MSFYLFLLRLVDVVGRFFCEIIWFYRIVVSLLLRRFVLEIRVGLLSFFYGFFILSFLEEEVIFRD